MQYGNIGSIEKRLPIYNCDRERKHLGDIATLPAIEFAAYSNYPFRPAGGGRAARKNGAATPSNPWESVAETFYLQVGARPRYVLQLRGGQKPLQIPLNFKVSAQKVSDPEFAGQIRPNTFKLPQSPLFSAISRFRTYLLIPIDCRPARRRKPVPCRAPQWRRLQPCPQK